MEHITQNKSIFLNGFGMEGTGIGYEIMQNYILVALTIKFLMGCKLRHIWIILGLLLNEGFNYILKNIIRQPRPATSLKGGYGMPSDHTQFMGFFLVQTLWENYTFKKQSLLIQASRFFVILLMSIAVGYGRIVMNFHTTQQILAGYIIGTVMSLFWVWLHAKLFQWSNSKAKGFVKHKKMA